MARTHALLLASAAVALLALLASPSRTAASSSSSEVEWIEVSPSSSSSSSPSSDGPVGDDTWAVIVSTSRYWLNYRHATNAFAMYRAVKRMGVPDSRILLMVAEDFSANPRNVFPNALFADPGLGTDVRAGDAEVDYAGDEVTAETLVRVLTGRQDPRTPRSRTLGSTATSDVWVYVTGHGGENFMKFQDSEQMTGEDLADAVDSMSRLGRYGRLALVVDTCKASTWCRHLSSPHVSCLASSLRGENSYSAHASRVVGNSLVDEMTYLLHLELARRARGGAGGSALVDPGEGENTWRALRRRQEASTPFFSHHHQKTDDDVRVE